MGIAVHTGVGHGAIRPSGRSVQPNGLADFAFVHPGQYGTSESLVFSDKGVITALNTTYVDGFTFSDGVGSAGLTPGTYADNDSITDSVFGAYPKGSTAETFSPVDSPSQNISYNATKTETAPLADSSIVRKDGSQETLSLTDSGVKT